jgi:hypothetical protein
VPAAEDGARSFVNSGMTKRRRHLAARAWRGGSSLLRAVRDVLPCFAGSLLRFLTQQPLLGRRLRKLIATDNIDDHRTISLQGFGERITKF